MQTKARRVLCKIRDDCARRGRRSQKFNYATVIGASILLNGEKFLLYSDAINTSQQAEYGKIQNDQTSNDIKTIQLQILTFHA